MAQAHRKRPRKLERHLPVMRANAGGVDIGATEIFVAVPADRDAESVRSFPAFTEDLHRRRVAFVLHKAIQLGDILVVTLGALHADRESGDD